MQYKRKRDIENTVYSLCYDYFSSDTFNKIPELVSYKSLKGLQPLISNKLLYLFIYLGFYVVFNTVQVISRRVVGRAEETST